jgi:hypothetical protein
VDWSQAVTTGDLSLVRSPSQSSSNVASGHACATNKSRQGAEVMAGDGSDEEQSGYARLESYVQYGKAASPAHLFPYGWIDEGKSLDIRSIAGCSEEVVHTPRAAILQRDSESISLWMGSGNLRARGYPDLPFHAISKPFRPSRTGSALVNLAA